MLSRVMNSPITFHVLFWGNVACALQGAFTGSWGGAAVNGAIAAGVLAAWRQL